jgi:hypothetical protein
MLVGFGSDFRIMGLAFCTFAPRHATHRSQVHDGSCLVAMLGSFISAICLLLPLRCTKISDAPQHTGPLHHALGLFALLGWASDTWVGLSWSAPFSILLPAPAP